MSQQPWSDIEPMLTVIVPGPDEGRSWQLGPAPVILGRADDADLRVVEPTVSRHHARFERSGGRTMVTDLGSTGGTKVNGATLQGCVQLFDGDQIALASLELQFRGPSQPSADTTTRPAGTMASEPATYVVGQQSAHQLNNVAGNQYNHYLQTVHAQRESFMREIAATRTRARVLIWFGLMLYVVGAGTFGAMLIRFMSETADFPESFEEAQGGPDDFLGPRFGSIPIGLIGFGAAGLGTLVLAIGVVLHIVATSRRRRVERDFTPMPPAAFNTHHPS